MPPLAYGMEQVDLGRADRYGDPVTSLAAVATELPQEALAGGRGRSTSRNVQRLLDAMRAHEGALENAWSRPEMNAMCDRLGMTKATRTRTVNDVVLGFMHASVGGNQLR